MNKVKILVYHLNTNSEVEAEDIDPGFTQINWKPSISKIFPIDQNKLFFFIFWVFHYVKIFKNPNYSVNIIFDKNEVANRMVIFPLFFKFPFMAKNDLQIGFIDSNPKYQKKGLAKYNLKKVINSNLNKNLWYLTEENNQPSIKLAESCNFKFFAYAEKSIPFGIKPLGRFIIRQKI